MWTTLCVPRTRDRTGQTEEINDIVVTYGRRGRLAKADSHESSEIGRVQRRRASAVNPRN